MMELYDSEEADMLARDNENGYLQHPATLRGWYAVDANAGTRPPQKR